MKNSHSIFLALTLIFIVNIGLANTEGSDDSPINQEQEQDGRRKESQTMMRPDGNVDSEMTDSVEEYSVSNSEEAKVEVIDYQKKESIDSLKDDSVSKYNFIFYFLYKFKYDTKTSP
ncbi:hypothetical protein [Ekhidna sp.]